MHTTPRDCLADPTGFGRSRPVEWVASETPRDVALLAAAQLQHAAAVHVRVFLGAEERTLGWVAQTLGWRRERLSRVVGGQVWVGLADLEQLLRVCGSSVVGVSWMSTRVEDRATPARQIVVGYLRDQLRRLEPGSSTREPRN